MQGAGALLLQREIPEHVNEALAKAAQEHNVPVMQDIGGEDRSISDAMLRCCTYVSPNKPELERLTGMPVGTEEQVIAAARSLQSRGAKHVLVTLGEGGALLVQEGGKAMWQPCWPVPGSKVADATGAGDAFRAAFAVAVVEGRPLQDCLAFASAAGAIAVSEVGAVPQQLTRHSHINDKHVCLYIYIYIYVYIHI